MPPATASDLPAHHVRLCKRLKTAVSSHLSPLPAHCHLLLLRPLSQSTGTQLYGTDDIFRDGIIWESEWPKLLFVDLGSESNRVHNIKLCPRACTVLCSSFISPVPTLTLCLCCPCLLLLLLCSGSPPAYMQCVCPASTQTALHMPTTSSSPPPTAISSHMCSRQLEATETLWPDLMLFSWQPLSAKSDMN